MADRGEFLPGLASAAARRTRDALATLVSEGRREYAQMLLVGPSAQAAAAAQAAVASEPYREDGWRLLMRAQAAARGAACVVPTCLECVNALREVGLKPSRETRDLLERLPDGAPAIAAAPLPREVT